MKPKTKKVCRKELRRKNKCQRTFTQRQKENIFLKTSKNKLNSKHMHTMEEKPLTKLINKNYKLQT